MRSILRALILLFMPLHAVAANDPPPDVNAIIQRSVEANQRDWRAAPGFDYDEQDREADGSTRTYREMMILGSQYERLIAVNGEPISPQQQAAERAKLEDAIAARNAESPAERAKRIAKYERERSRDELLVEQLAVAFQFQIVGEHRLGAHQVYVLKATPRPDYHAPNAEAEVLTGMEGRLWIDEQTFQWVKVEARVIHPVSIAGFLARVERGTRFLLEKAPVTDSVWLPCHFSMESRAKVLFFFSRHKEADEAYSNYEPSRLYPPGGQPGADAGRGKQH